jgi:hypothetical protein
VKPETKAELKVHLVTPKASPSDPVTARSDWAATPDSDESDIDLDVLEPRRPGLRNPAFDINAPFGKFRFYPSLTYFTHY